MDDLKTLVENYHPTPEAVKLVHEAHLVIFSGISGAGKDTIKRSVLASDSIFHEIVSHTTRQPRQNNLKMEVDGTDYHFIDSKKAAEMLKNHEFIEAKFVHGTVYGTSVAEIEESSVGKHIAIVDVDVQGVAEYKKLAPNSISIFIVPPSYEIWLERLKSRYTTEAEFETEWPKRRASSIAELTHALSVPYYHFIINDDIDRVTRVSREIATRQDVFFEKDNEARILAQRLLESIQAHDQ